MIWSSPLLSSSLSPPFLPLSPLPLSPSFPLLLSSPLLSLLYFVPLHRESSRSDKVLLEYDREQQSAQQQFQKQFSIGNSSSVSSQNSDQDTPNTATTLISDKNPFSFTPPIAVHTGTGMEYPRNASLGSMGRSFHMYPIPEHAPAHPCIPPGAHPHPHTLPNQWQIHPYPISDNLHQQNSREEFEMIENPFNRQFEEEKVESYPRCGYLLLVSIWFMYM